MSFKNIHDIKLADIWISSCNVREANSQVGLDELAASIKKHGLLQPIVLRGKYGTPPYELIAGQRRFLAHQRLKAKKIRAVFAGDIDDTQAILLSLVENLQTVDLNHADSAHAITDLYERYGKDERRVQRETGLSIQTIRDYLRIEAQATPKMKRLMNENKVTKADVKRALRAAIGNVKKAETLLELMAEQPLTKHQKKRVVEYGTQNQRATAKRILSEAIRPRVEQSILVSLPENIRLGLEKAIEEFDQEAEEIVADVLQDWLQQQGYDAQVN